MLRFKSIKVNVNVNDVGTQDCVCIGKELESESESRSVVSDSLGPHGLYSPWSSLGQNTGAGSLSLLQGIFPTQGSNPGLPHCRRILYQLSHKGSPRKLEWVAYPFSRGSSRLRNWTRVSCIAGGFFTNWDIRKLEPGVKLSWFKILYGLYLCNFSKPFLLVKWA